MDHSFLAFLGVSVLVIVTPGPDTALTIRNTVVSGRRGGIVTALGVAFGQLIWAIFTRAGVIAILLASEPVFAWLAFYATVVSAAGGVLRAPRVRHVVEAVAGAVLVGLGVRLATEGR